MGRQRGKGVGRTGETTWGATGGKRRSGMATVVQPLLAIRGGLGRWGCSVRAACSRRCSVLVVDEGSVSPFGLVVGAEGVVVLVAGGVEKPRTPGPLHPDPSCHFPVLDAGHSRALALASSCMRRIDGGVLARSTGHPLLLVRVEASILKDPPVRLCF